MKRLETVFMYGWSTFRHGVTYKTHQVVKNEML